MRLPSKLRAGAAKAGAAPKVGAEPTNGRDEEEESDSLKRVFMAEKNELNSIEHPDMRANSTTVSAMPRSTSLKRLISKENFEPGA
jgi:hypothetical protein